MFAAQISKQLPILILISFDGFRFDYLSPEIAPNLFDISKRSTVGHMESLYITKTFPNHFSIATGLYEDEHEIINNKMFDPSLNETFKPGVNSIEWWNPKGTNLPIWTANELYGRDNHVERRISGSMMYPGSSTPYKDQLPTYLQDFNTNRNWTRNVDTVIDWLTNPEAPANFVCMYFDDPDSTAHNHGPWGQATLDAIRRVDSAAGYLIKRLRDVQLADVANIIFVSDHGMAEVNNVVYLEDIMDTNNFHLFGATPDWSVFVKPEFRHLKGKIFRDFVRLSRNNHFRIYKREDIPADYHYSKSARIGDFFILVDQHYDLYLKRPKTAPTANGTQERPKVWGNHGWKPTERDMRPLFMAHGPSFKQKFDHVEPFPNIDLFPLMLFLLDLPSESFPNNGSLARIVDVIDIGHFGRSHDTLKLVKVFFVGISLLMLSGIIFALFASCNRPKYKPEVDFDDLPPGLDIDLSYYVEENSNNYNYQRNREFENKKNRKRKEELLSLLNTP